MSTSVPLPFGIKDVRYEQPETGVTHQGVVVHQRLRQGSPASKPTWVTEATKPDTGNSSL
eukprot:5558252-Amphidinium_carterae.5